MDLEEEILDDFESGNCSEKEETKEPLSIKVAIMMQKNNKNSMLNYCKLK